MSYQEREPYCATRVHISESTTQKTLGMKSRSIEVTFGNQDVKKLVKSKEDIADIKEITISQELEKVWDEITELGHKKGWKFTEDYSNE
jgi:hypothetical protein